MAHLGSDEYETTADILRQNPSSTSFSKEKPLVATSWGNVIPGTPPPKEAQAYPPGPGKGCRSIITAFFRSI